MMWCQYIFLYKLNEILIYVGNCIYFQVPFSNIQATILYWGLFLDLQKQVDYMIISR